MKKKNLKSSNVAPRAGTGKSRRVAFSSKTSSAPRWKAQFWSWFWPAARNTEGRWEWQKWWR